MAGAKKKSSVGTIFTPAFRVSYPNVFKPTINELSKKEEYNLTALFELGADLSVLKNAVLAVCIEKWGADKTKWPKKRDGSNAIRSPFRDQAEREKTNEDGTKFMPAGYVKGATFITLKCYRQPGIVDQKRQPIIEETEFYAGCWARASVSPFAYDTAGNFGVSLWLNNLQKVRDDDPFSGRRRAEDEFESIATGEDASGGAVVGASTEDIFGGT